MNLVVIVRTKDNDNKRVGYARLDDITLAYSTNLLSFPLAASLPSSTSLPSFITSNLEESILVTA